MKYFNPSYWFKLWVLSAPLFNSENQGINAKSINNKNIKDWTSKNITNLDSINESLILSNNNKTIDFINYQTYLDLQKLDKNLTSTTLPTELSVIPYQHYEKSKNRIKRELNGGNEGGTSKKGVYHQFLIYKPEFWEEIVQLKIFYSLPLNEDFIKKYTDKIWNGDFSNWNYLSMGSGSIHWYWRAGDFTYYYFWSIANKFIDSSRRKRIKIKYDLRSTGSSSTLYGVEILTEDTINYPNKYLDNLERDFPDWNKLITINLGIINEYVPKFENGVIINQYENIKNAIKQKYPNLDLSKISIVDKSDYSNFCECFSAKIYSSLADGTYSFGNLQPTFTYITQTKLNEINDIIANNPKVIQWLKHINDYNKDLPKKIENLKKYTDSQKWSHKSIEKEIIKGYIRDWSYVSTLIEHEFKLEELNKNVQGLKANFEAIKNQINKLDRRVQNLENQSNLNCANTATVTAGVTSAIPVIGTIAAAMATITAGTCAIAGV